ncbi:MAG: lytic transglycosylase domain-containing protein, partial [Bacillota bacterium]
VSCNFNIEKRIQRKAGRMAINIINPNTLQNIYSTGLGQNSKNLTGDAANGAPSFSDVLEAAVAQNNIQNSAVNGNISSNAENITVNLDEIFQKASDTYNVPANLLKAVAKAESNFNPNAESHAGAKGIMQRLLHITLARVTLLSIMVFLRLRKHKTILRKLWHMQESLLPLEKRHFPRRRTWTSRTMHF